jgi:hypothetical protein
MENAKLVRAHSSLRDNLAAIIIHFWIGDLLFDSVVVGNSITNSVKFKSSSVSFKAYLIVF